jgi:cytidylate kinase-like protein
VLRPPLQGNVLVKGWGAATLLRDIPQVISVRVCAPTDFRVRTLMDRLGSKDAAAVRAHIERQDAARARTFRAFFGTEEEDARLHHLVLNAAHMSVEDCVTAVAELACSPRFRNPTAFRSTLSNKLTEVQISAAFAERISPSMAPLGVSVSVTDGKITLTGVTSSGSLRCVAERIAHAIAEPYEIDNRIISVPSHGRL